jgi:hypothetical protein
MKRLISLVVAASGLGLLSCKRDTTTTASGASGLRGEHPSERSPRVPPLQSTATGSDKEDRIPNPLTVISTITATTEASDPALAYVREQIQTTSSSKILDALSINPAAMKNAAVVRLLHEQYGRERSHGRFWGAGALLIGRTGNPMLAAELWEDWKRFPAYKRPEVMSWGEMAQVVGEPKYVLAGVIFDLGNLSVIDSLWRAFPTMLEGDQFLVARAAGVHLDPFVAGDLVKRLDSAQTDDVRMEMTNSANRILFHLLTNSVGENRVWVLKTTRPILEEMGKRGAIRDYLAEIIPQ